MVLEQKAFWQGPLPPPIVLEQFRQLVPDAPERIFRQWEAEADHRRAYEREALDGTLRQNRRGQAAAIAFALTALAVAAFALYLGYPTTAGVIGGTTIVSTVLAFLAQRATAVQRKPDGP